MARQKALIRILKNCILSNGCLVYAGQPKLVYPRVTDDAGAIRAAHVVMYEASKGPVPEGMIVGHTCRNSRCCAPIHLVARTRQENIQILHPNAGWWNQAGEHNHHAKVSNEEANTIRILKDVGVSTSEIADTLQVSHSLIYGVLHRHRRLSSLT